MFSELTNLCFRFSGGDLKTIEMNGVIYLSTKKLPKPVPAKKRKPPASWNINNTEVRLKG